MKFRKARGSLLGLGIATIILAVALFFLVPVIFKETFLYSGIDALGDGAIELIGFNFSNVLYTALIVLFVVVFAVKALWALRILLRVLDTFLKGTAILNHSFSSLSSSSLKGLLNVI